MQRHCLPLRHAFAFPFPVTATAARAVLLGSDPATANADMNVRTVRCEYFDDPLNIDVPQKLLSGIESERRRNVGATDGRVELCIGSGRDGFAASQ